MHHLRRLRLTRTRALAVGALVLVLAACTPEDMARWTTYARPLAGGQTIPCAQWLGTSRVAGWTDDLIPTLHALMWAESRCDPSAHSPSGASGLMQEMPAWAAACGGTPAELFDPLFALRCALVILATQGWQAWSTYPP